MVSEPVIQVSELTRRFGAKPALDAVSVFLPRGAVYGLVGANGAGKTTPIKHILGLLRAESGSVRVFGLDPVANPVPVLSRIGYLSEENDLPGWMRVDELMRIFANGLSNGGGMTFALSCTLSRRIAAFGPVAAAVTLPVDWCPDSRPAPMIAFHGTADRFTPYDGAKVWLAPDPFPGIPEWTAT